MARTRLIDFLNLIAVLDDPVSLKQALRNFVTADGAELFEIGLNREGEDRATDTGPLQASDDSHNWHLPLSISHPNRPLGTTRNATFDDEGSEGTIGLRFTRPPDDELQAEIDMAIRLTAGSLRRLRQLEAAEAARSTAAHLLGVAAHDLRAPLGVIESSAQILSHPEANATSKAAALGWLTRQITIAGELIGTLLDYSTLQTGTRQLRRAACDLAPHLRSIVTALTLNIDASRIALELDRQLPCHVDIARMHQVVTNLLTNAMTHGQPDGPIAIRASVQQGTLWLEVENTASAATLETLQGLLDPGDQGGRSPPYRPPSPGASSHTGLGLFIVKGIVEAHRGRLSCRTLDGSRLVISVEIPPEPSVADRSS